MRILTFDIEEWFHLLDNESTKAEPQWNSYESRLNANVDRLLSLLDEKKVRATFFCLGWVVRKYPEVIRRIHALGFELASHSMLHQLAYEQTPAEFKADVTQSVDLIQQTTGTKVRAYRVPGFSVTEANPWVFDVLVECGMEVDSSVFPGTRGHGGLRSFGADSPAVIRTAGGELREFPITVASVLGKPLAFGGGGYFRLLPYSIVKYLTKRSPCVMTYFHPRDFDPGQPLIPGLRLTRRFKCYVGLRGALGKLRKLLSDFSFVDLAGAEKLVDWASAPRVHVGR